MSNFNNSIRPVASFTFETNKSLVNPVNLCLVPGHYNTIEGFVSDEKVIISYANKEALQAAGYSCDQVADDYNAQINNVRGDAYPVTIRSKGNVLYRDFLNYIKYSGLKVVKMRITDLNTGDAATHEIFQQVIEVTQSSIGSKHGSDFIQLASYINPAHYLQNFIDIDLEKDERKLSLDETTLAFLKIPAGAKFQIDFTLAK